jgi:antitoxin component of MazEF toxin-antitoxin module
MQLEITRLIKFGNSLGVTIPTKLLASVRWNVGDRIALRYAEGKLILDRVPLEQLGKLRAGVANGE